MRFYERSRFSNKTVFVVQVSNINDERQNQSGEPKFHYLAHKLVGVIIPFMRLVVDWP